MELARYRYTDWCIGCQHARLGLKRADHNEECRARIVRHMTADDNLNQRAQIAQDRIVETTPPEARTGERDPAPEPARKKVRFAERVDEQTPEGTVATSSSSSSGSSSSCPSSSQTAIVPSMQVDGSNEGSSKRQKVTHGADIELKAEGPRSGERWHGLRTVGSHKYDRSLVVHSGSGQYVDVLSSGWFVVLSEVVGGGSRHSTPRTRC